MVEKAKQLKILEYKRKGDGFKVHFSDETILIIRFFEQKRKSKEFREYNDEIFERLKPLIDKFL